LLEGLAWITFLGASFLGLRTSLLDFACPLAIVCLLNGPMPLADYATFPARRHRSIVEMGVVKPAKCVKTVK
jgi:hypothetical protein